MLNGYFSSSPRVSGLLEKAPFLAPFDEEWENSTGGIYGFDDYREESEGDESAALCACL
jgi:hypothetical protein